MSKHKLVIADTLTTLDASWQVYCECGWKHSSVMTEDAAEDVADMHRNLADEVEMLTTKLGAATVQYDVMREGYEPLAQEHNAVKAQLAEAIETLRVARAALHRTIAPMPVDRELCRHAKVLADVFLAKYPEKP